MRTDANAVVFAKKFYQAAPTAPVNGRAGSVLPARPETPVERRSGRGPGGVVRPSA
ncbi:hypothetical protein STXM2123_543 [Streptomyces sp. F-3]|nr:hypothetical protein STXM2123_543 [Streptomyces sp. F-3]